MFARVLLVMLLATPFVSAQRGGGGGGGQGGGSGAPAMQTRDPTPLDQFVDRLRLNETQVTEVEKIFNAANQEASPVSKEMIQLRQRMLDIESGKSDDLPAVLGAYTAAAAKMTGIEIRAFDKVKAVLKPGQLSKIADGFVVIAGVFNPPTPRAGGPGGRRGGGGQ